jgi:hypothetical protein
VSLQEIPLGDLYRAKGVALASVGQADSSAYFLVNVENRRIASESSARGGQKQRDM